MERTLDRLVEFHAESLDYPIRTLVAGYPGRSYTWSCSYWFDQGNEGACVEFAWRHEAAARPVLAGNRIQTYPLYSLYHEMQKIDQWPGENYSGTSVIAGAQIMQKEGFLGEYRWGLSLQDAVLAIGYKGPGVFGINWYPGMLDVDSEGFIHPTGSIAGGHAILGNRVKLVWQPLTTTEQKRSDRWFEFVDMNKSYIGLHNSWGQDWGVNGEAKIALTDVNRLLHEDGEFCIPVVRK